MRKVTAWEARAASNPNHSQWYVERFRRMAAEGADLAGANLTNANARGADLRHADLTGVTWSNTTCGP